MNLEKNLLEVQSEIIAVNEGLVFFKDSKRLKKLSKEISTNAIKAAGSEGYEEVKEVVVKVEEIAREFAELERKYKGKSSDEKKDIRRDYDLLKSKYKDIILIINNQTYRALARTGFNFALIAAPLVFAFAQVHNLKKSVDVSTTTLSRISAGVGADAVAQSSGLDPHRVAAVSRQLSIPQSAAERVVAQEVGNAANLSKVRGEASGDIMFWVRDAFAKTLGFIGLSRVFENIVKSVGNTELTSKTRQALKKLEQMQVEE